MVPNQGWFGPLGHIWQCLEILLVVTTMDERFCKVWLPLRMSIFSSDGETRYAAKHLKMCRTASTAQNYTTPNVNNAETQKLWALIWMIKLHIYVSTGVCHKSIIFSTKDCWQKYIDHIISQFQIKPRKHCCILFIIIYICCNF